MGRMLVDFFFVAYRERYKVCMGEMVGPQIVEYILQIGGMHFTDWWPIEYILQMVEEYLRIGGIILQMVENICGLLYASPRV